MNSGERPVVILGAGVNGAALARELACNGVSVVVVERHDIAAGTTAYSSRLIHGGLRYLEYGEFALVRESLAERTRWLRLAPHLVRPLPLWIPIGNMCGGLWTSARRFFGFRECAGNPPRRGAIGVRFGLWLYDRFAHDASLPRSRITGLSAHHAVPVNPARFRWLCSYHDAQIMFAERMTVELLQDAQRSAQETGASFELVLGATARLERGIVQLIAADGREIAGNGSDIRPSAIVNATGAWVDDTLARLHIDAPRLIGGTKGSHFLTEHAGLREMLAGQGVYAEAADGRPVFILPFGDSTLVGTTDEPYSGPPEAALATQAELDYLLRAVNEVLRDVHLTAADISMHYCGVRPLPFVNPTTPAAITRRHFLHSHPQTNPPIFSIVGGKLTTCRSLAESATATILIALCRTPTQNTRDRPLPGGTDYPATTDALTATWQRLGVRYGLRQEQVRTLWWLFGTRSEEVLRDAAARGESTSDDLPDTDLPTCVARFAIRQEWARTLEDLVERRLMLLYHPQLSISCLRALSRELTAAGLLAEADQTVAIAALEQRLASRFGKSVRA